jgi:type II secretory pathway component PulF
MFKNDQLTNFLEAMANQLESNVTVLESVENLADAFESHTDTLHEIVRSMHSGNSFTQNVSALLPPDMHGPIEIGETSGTLPFVFRSLQTHHSRFYTQLKTAKSKLIKPAFILIAAICAFILFMLVIFPLNAKALPPDLRNEGIFWLSNQFVYVLETAPWFYFIPPCTIVFLFVYTTQSAEFRSTMLDASLKLPVYGQGMTKMYISSWCNYVSLAVKAGLGHVESITMTNKMLPDSMKPLFESLINDLAIGGWSTASDPNHWSDTDGRRQWPLMLRLSLQNGGPQGTLDRMLLSASNSIMVEAEREIAQGIAIATTIATTLAVGCVLTLAISMVLAQTASFA